jgi:glyoxylase-like metal-dependent hydrolase (beta-lactamase superfamily II)
MRLYHLNCGTMFLYFHLIRGVIYCLLLETNDGLLLVDTGIGVKDYTTPTWFMHLFTQLVCMPRDLEETAARQIIRLGYRVADVKHIVMTHLHLDHASGLSDFPDAQVHIFRPEYEIAMRKRGLMTRGYITDHWSHGPHWIVHENDGEKWFDFDSFQVQEGLQPEVRMIPLPGHTPGHCGVAIKTPGGWLFHCGDAVSRFYPAADPYRLSDGTPNWLVRQLIGEHVPRLRTLIREHGDEVRIIGAHDSHSLSKYRKMEKLAKLGSGM